MTNSLETKEKFQTLPDDAQEAIRQFEYDKTLKEIHNMYKLHIDQAYSLENIVSDVIFGETETHTLISLLTSELRLTQEQATKLSMDINTKILLPIQNKMREIQALA